jgi:hypothetical protein
MPVCYIPVSLEEIVVERKRPSRKAWVTPGSPACWSLGNTGWDSGSRPPPGSHLTVFIDYRWPANPWLQMPARLLASSYARWCCRQMVRDARNLG